MTSPLTASSHSAEEGTWALAASRLSNSWPSEVRQTSALEVVEVTWGRRTSSAALAASSESYAVPSTVQGAGGVAHLGECLGRCGRQCQRRSENRRSGSPQVASFYKSPFLEARSTFILGSPPRHRVTPPRSFRQMVAFPSHAMDFSPAGGAKPVFNTCYLQFMLEHNVHFR